MDLRDGDAVREVIVRERPQTLFHLAGTRGHGTLDQAWSDCVEVNVAATVRVLSAARMARVRRVVILGSAAEYGDQGGPLRETMPLRPQSPNGLSKAAATAFARRIHELQQLPVVNLRPFTVYGPWQPGHMFVAEAVNHALANRPYAMSRGLHRHDLIFVDDAVRAIIAASYSPNVEGRVINVGSGRDYSLREIAEAIWRISGSSAPLQFGTRPAPCEFLHDTSADISVARELLGWAPQIDIESGLRRCVEWAKEENRIVRESS